MTPFWDVAERAGLEMDIASPAGGMVPLDPESLSHEVLAELGTEQRYQDREFMDLPPSRFAFLGDAGHRRFRPNITI
ncbi:hypothetical protein [Saccharopolyspora shandongensis]|uniref:hypothetical protein n=1 Tax=Saccharopolyspora shandongensis TaxID=418495 RepID=UPI0033C1357F